MAWSRAGGSDRLMSHHANQLAQIVVGSVGDAEDTMMEIVGLVQKLADLLPG